MPIHPLSLQALLDTWSSEPGTPRLTWYGPNSERVELTGRVLGTWVAKAANLLAEEGDTTADTDVRLDIPAHWRAAVWALATWARGATVTLDGRADVAVTSRRDPLVQADLMIHIALGALAMQTDGVPPDAVDGAAEAMSQPDVLMEPVPAGPARLLHRDQTVDLLAAAPERARVLVHVTSPADPAALAEVLQVAMSTWLAGGSLVLVGDPGADVAHLAAQESAVRQP